MISGMADRRSAAGTDPFRAAVMTTVLLFQPGFKIFNKFILVD